MIQNRMFQTGDQNLREAILQIAVSTGNQDIISEMALEPPPTVIDSCPQDEMPSTACWTEHQAHCTPVIPIHQITEAYQGLGVALFHIGSAVLDYGIIEDLLLHREPKELLLRYLWAENNARIAHTVLNRVSHQLADHTDLGPEIRKYARQAHIWLTTQRTMAAQALGIDPPPQVEEYSRTDALDLDLGQDEE